MRAAGAGLAGGSAALLAACGTHKRTAAASRGSDVSTNTTATADVAVLNLALDVENLAVAAYSAGVKLLTGEALKLGQAFLMQETEHVNALSEAIKLLGGTPNPPKPSYDLGKLATQKDFLRLAVRIESSAIAAYIDAIPKFTMPVLRATAAAIVTNEAEHLAVLRGALNRPPVPAAFVTGRK
jgi:rubrerythrin